jgi:hypothetical protein
MSAVSSITSLFSGQQRLYAICDQDTDAVILSWDSCITFDYHNESSISDAPQEQGAFISYNKVASPFVIHTRATKSNASDRAQFLEDCEKLLDSLTLYKFVTPDRVYNDVNLTSIDYQRGADAGYSLLAVDFVLKEVRINKNSRYQKAAEPSGESKKSTGQVTAK